MILLASSNELRNERNRYYNLRQAINNAINTLSGAPEYLSWASGSLSGSFTINDGRADNREIDELRNNTNDLINRLKNVRTNIDRQIYSLNNKVKDAEAKELLGGGGF